MGFHAIVSEKVYDSERASDFAELSPLSQPCGDSVESIAEQLKAIGPGNSLDQMLRLGEIVHRALGPNRRSQVESSAQASLRRIAAHPGVPFKVTTIWRAVSVYELSLCLPHLFGVPGLGVSHFRAVIGLKLTDQNELLMRAAEEKWTKRQLERAAAERRDGNRRRGRRPTPKALLWARELQRQLDRRDDFDVSTLEEGARGELERVLESLEAESRQLRQRLEVSNSPSTDASSARAWPTGGARVRG